MKANSVEWWNNQFETSWKVNGPPQTRYFMELILKYCGIADLGTVLDYGCAMGQGVELIPGAEGYDFSPAGIKAAREMVPDHIFHDTMPDKKYDTVICSNVLEHLVDPMPVFRNLFRLAKKHVIIMTPYNQLPPSEVHPTPITQNTFPEVEGYIKAWRHIPNEKPEMMGSNQIMFVYEREGLRMYEVSVTTNPYIGLNGTLGNDHFFMAESEEEYNKSGRFNAVQVMEGYRKRSDKPIDTIIDIGCGNLRIGRFLAKEGTSYIGVDISRNVLKSAQAKAEEYGLNNVKLVPMDEFDGENICDLLICFHVVQHNPYDAQIDIIRKIEKALKPGAWACIHLPSLENQPGYINYNTCMCFTRPQVEALGSYFAKCEIEVQTTMPGWDDYYLWGHKI
jgi:2-polyprenyl-3-methyl-5-hydroxy-6-metoxy-1,4-benzoquinol methylase